MNTLLLPLLLLSGQLPPALAESAAEEMLRNRAFFAVELERQHAVPALSAPQSAWSEVLAITTTPTLRPTEPMKSTLLILPLLAGSLVAATPEEANLQSGPQDIVSTAIAAGSFDTLATALQAAGLVGTLRGEGPFTVFAPTDEAFAALPKGTVETLLKPENRSLLQAVLKFHVVSGDYRAASVVASPWLTSLQGQRLGIEAGENGVRIANASVLKTDIECSNGVIHVIDRVVLPSTVDVVELAVENGSFKTLAAALDAAGLVSALKSDGPFTVFAPTDAAFAKLPAGTVETLLKPENKAKLAAVLKHHVVPGRVLLGDALKAGSAVTLQGGSLSFRFAEGAIRVGSARITVADLEAANGVIHVIDEVILPR